jgi:hypothetical protein
MRQYSSWERYGPLKQLLLPTNYLAHAGFPQRVQRKERMALSAPSDQVSAYAPNRSSATHTCVHLLRNV